MIVEENVKRILTEKGIPFELLEHEPVYTSEQAAKARGLDSAKFNAKAMIFRAGDTFILVVSPGDRKIDTKRIAQLESAKHISLASPEEVERIAGVKIGSVPPFGLKTQLKTYVNEEILQNEYVYFNCGSHTRSIKMLAKDLPKAVGKPVMFR